jgi:hypothetical protein
MRAVIHRPPLLLVIAMALVFLRSWPRIVKPEVWDEDGTQLLAGYLVHGWSDILQPVNGYLITISKLIFYGAASITLLRFPEVGTLLAWLTTAGILVVVARAPLALRGGVLLALAAALVPIDPEVFGLPLYSFWWSAVLLFALCCGTPDDPRWLWRAFWSFCVHYLHQSAWRRCRCSLHAAPCSAQTGQNAFSQRLRWYPPGFNSLRCGPSRVVWD